VVISNPIPQKRSLISSTFTGDGTDDRQIAVGFKCSEVILFAPLSDECALFIPGEVRGLANMAAKGGGSEIHATDGFTVYETGDALNGNTVLYRYWAIEAD